MTRLRKRFRFCVPATGGPIWRNLAIASARLVSVDKACCLFRATIVSNALDSIEAFVRNGTCSGAKSP